MPEKPNSLQFGSPGQTEPSASDTTPQGETGNEQTPTAEPQYVTKADLDAAVQEAIRKAQSMVGKANAKVQQRLDALEKAGIKATPEQAAALIAAEEGAAPTGTQQPAPDQTRAAAAGQQDQQAPPDDGTVHPVTLQAYRLMAEAGVVLNDDDPEVANVRTKDVTPEEYLADIKAAVQAKAERLQREGNPARMPGLGTGAPSGKPYHEGLSGRETLDSYFRQKP